MMTLCGTNTTWPKSNSNRASNSGCTAVKGSCSQTSPAPPESTFCARCLRRSPTDAAGPSPTSPSAARSGMRARHGACHGCRRIWASGGQHAGHAGRSLSAGRRLAQREPHAQITSLACALAPACPSYTARSDSGRCRHAFVAQSDSAPVYGTGGCRFDPCRRHTFPRGVTGSTAPFGGESPGSNPGGGATLVWLSGERSQLLPGRSRARCPSSSAERAAVSYTALSQVRILSGAQHTYHHWVQWDAKQ